MTIFFWITMLIAYFLLAVAVGKLLKARREETVIFDFEKEFPKWERS